MLAEAILISCLAPAPMAFAHADTQGAISAIRAIIQSVAFPRNPNQAMIDHIRTIIQKFPRHHSRLGMEGMDMLFGLNVREKVLVVGGDPIHVRTLRQYGQKAFGALTQDFSGTTKWHTVANPGSLPFFNDTFGVVFWHHIWITDPARHLAWFRDVIRLVDERGYFIFNEERYPHWAVMLGMMNWIPIPEPKNILGYQLSIWQKPPRRRVHAKILFWKSPPVPIPQAIMASA